jgi:hypothetical protein
MELLMIPIRKPAEVNLILGQGHFIKIVDDLHEASPARCRAPLRARLLRVLWTGPCPVERHRR